MCSCNGLMNDCPCCVAWSMSQCGPNPFRFQNINSKEQKIIDLEKEIEILQKYKATSSNNNYLLINENVKLKEEIEELKSHIKNMKEFCNRQDREINLQRKRCRFMDKIEKENEELKEAVMELQQRISGYEYNKQSVKEPLKIEVGKVYESSACVRYFIIGIADVYIYSDSCEYKFKGARLDGGGIQYFNAIGEPFNGLSLIKLSENQSREIEL